MCRLDRQSGQDASYSTNQSDLRPGHNICWSTGAGTSSITASEQKNPCLPHTNVSEMDDDTRCALMESEGDYSISSNKTPALSHAEAIRLEAELAAQSSKDFVDALQRQRETVRTGLNNLVWEKLTSGNPSSA